MVKRKARHTAPPVPTVALVLDNGAYTMKAGLVATDGGDNETETRKPEPTIIPNCLARDRQRRTYVASELGRCQDFGEVVFRRPVEKGYIVNWEAERAIWDYEFVSGQGSLGLGIDPSETQLVLTEQPNALPVLQTNCDQMVFEEFQFASYYRGTAAQFNAYLDLGSHKEKEKEKEKTEPAEIRLVIDAGYSFTTVTPVLQGRPLQAAVRRLDVGGKLLTNYLTKLLSMRHYDMRHDTYIVNEIKEKACFVSLDFPGDLERTWKGTRPSLGEDNTHLARYRNGCDGLAKEYVLPDYHARMHGIVRDFDPVAAAARKRGGAGGAGGGLDASSEDLLVLRNERFAVPELLFRPSDVGLLQPGLPDVVAQSVACLPVGLWPALLTNIVVVGGCAELPGFVQRLQQEIQQRMPDDLLVRVTRPANPVTCTWRGAARWAAAAASGDDADLRRLAVTKQEYDEHGAAWVARKFAAGG